MSFSQHLIIWYEKNKRNLPWRETKDPYKIWLSEIILQQTRVEQGIPYYFKFIENYPSLKSLANADEQDVLKLWEGLGYYSRARNMLIAAKQILGQHQGKLPVDMHDLLQIKGIGKYTAAAISSIAYNQPNPVVDGNVQRVISRLYEITEPVDGRLGIKIIDNIASELFDDKHPSTYNQAMMELGATVCTPKKPSCEICPVNQYCQSFANHSFASFPVKKNKIKVRNRYFKYLFLISEASVFMRERPNGDIWQGLWEPILLECDAMSELDNLEFSIFSDLALKVKIKSETITHQLTHQKIYCVFTIAESFQQLDNLKGYRKIKISEISTKALPILVKRFVELVLFSFIDEANIE